MWMTIQYHGENHNVNAKIVNGKPHLDLDTLNITLAGAYERYQDRPVLEENEPKPGSIYEFLSGNTRGIIEDLKNL